MKERFMMTLVSILSLVMLWPSAQLYAPNEMGVSMGHVYTIVRDVDTTERFWILMGGIPLKVDGVDVIKFPGIFIFLRKGEPSGGTAGTAVDHIGFHVPNGEELVAKLRAAGVKMDPNAGTRRKSTWGNVYSPDGVKVEILDSSRSTAAIGTSGVPAPSPLFGSIASDHIHFFVPESSLADIQAWYAKTFGARPFVDRVSASFDAVRADNIPGVELKFSRSPDSPAPTKGRALDHIGFEVKNLEAFCKKLEASGVKLDLPYSNTRRERYASAELVDPWGTSIELTEGLNKL
jgi:catechol 2,3-dioxygenase-like lactoylglutathione lyase family enzyme